MADFVRIKDYNGNPVDMDAPDVGGGINRSRVGVASVPADPFGTNADAAITSDTTGSMQGKLRGLVKMIAERWPLSLGRKTAAASLPVTLSSDAPIPGKVSTSNVSTTPLGNGAAYNGTGEDVSGYQGIVVNVFADVASASGGLDFQFSSDNTNWDHSETEDVAAGVGAAFRIFTKAKYFRVVYTNGATPQSEFRLQTILHPTFPSDSEVSLGSIAAGSNFIGRVGKTHALLTATPTLDTSSNGYTDGQLLGGKLSFASAVLNSGGGLEILQAILCDKSGAADNHIDIDLILFDSDPTGTTFTDSADFTVAVADLAKIIGVVRFSDWADFAASAVAQCNLRMAVKLASGTTLYGALVCRGTRGFTGSSDLVLRIPTIQN